MAIEEIKYQNKIFAVIVYGNVEEKEGVQFFTPDQYALQMGKHVHKRGKMIKAHAHLPVRMELSGPLQEVLYIQEGKVKITFYGDKDEALESTIIKQGDMILLREGGHGFEFLEDTKMIEIKQGPYNPQSRRNLEVKE
jgi:uncharacterized protein YjlB